MKKLLKCNCTKCNEVLYYLVDEKTEMVEQVDVKSVIPTKFLSVKEDIEVRNKIVNCLRTACGENVGRLTSEIIDIVLDAAHDHN